MLNIDISAYVYLLLYWEMNIPVFICNEEADYAYPQDIVDFFSLFVSGSFGLLSIDIWRP